jgi:hypothetical protein
MMPRPKWEKLPTDPAKQPEYIERILQQTVSQKIKPILNKYRRLRDLQFRQPNWHESIDITSIRFKLAAAIQSRGIIADELCEHCKPEAKNNPVFTECVRIPSEQFGRCANCIYHQTSCTQGDESELHIPTLV